MAQIVPFAKARSELTALLDAAEKQNEHVVITRNGVPAAVMMSSDEYASLCETLEIIQDDDLMRALHASERDLRAGRTHEWEEVRKQVRRRGG